VSGRQPRRRSLWLGLGLSALLLAGLVLAPLLRVAPVEVATVTTAYPAQALTLLTATGYVIPQRKADVASKATGRLEWLGVDAGSRVKAGQIVAKLENRDLIAEHERAVANVAVARGQLGQARAELRDAQLVKARAAGLLSRKFVTQEVYDAAVARLHKAEAGVASAEAGILAAQAGAESANVAVEYTVIRAPFDGVVTVKNANIGDVVAPFSSAGQSKAAVVSMADLDTMQVEADVSESSLQKVQVGQSCEIQLDALPERRLLGTVQTIVPTVDKTKATVLAKVRFEEKDDRVLPEMSAKVAFLSRPLTPQERTPRTVVPPAAVKSKDGITTVMVVREAHAYATRVELSERLGEWQAITAGPKVGEQVVTSHPEQLQDGAAVAVDKP
jgi:RND family efflux transporter MFP subunit